MAPSRSPHGKRTSWCKASLRGYVREVTRVGDPPVIKGPQAAKFLLIIEIADTALNTRPAHSKRRGLSFHTNRRLRVRAERMCSSSPLSQTAQTQTHPKSMASVLFQYASKLAPAQTTRTAFLTMTFFSSVFPTEITSRCLLTVHGSCYTIQSYLHEGIPPSNQTNIIYFEPQMI